MYFSTFKRSEIKEANPDATFAEIQKLLSNAWKELSDEDKEAFNQKASEDKARYEAEMKEYKQALNVMDDDSVRSTTKKKKKAKKDPNAPKRVTTAYMLFVKEKRSEIVEKNPDASFGEIGKLMGTAFNALNEDEKKKYDDMITEDRERYDKEMKTYKEKQITAAGGDNSEDDRDSD